MNLRLCSMIFCAVMIWPLGAKSWASGSYDNAKAMVDALESAWDSQTNQPLQLEIEGFKIKSLGGTKKGAGQAAKSEITVKVYYPEGSGSREVDALIKKYAEEKMSVYEEDAKEFLAQEQSAPGLKITTFVTARPSAGYLTVLFFDSGYLGGAHGFKEYTAKTYDLKEGRELAPADFFANPEDPEDSRQAQFFVNHVNAALDKNCFEQQKEASFCAPAGLTVENALENLHNVVFTSAGLALIYGPYEQGSYAEGTKYVDVPQAELMNWGFADKYWK